MASKRVLAVVSEPVSADALRSAVGTEDAEVLVVAPALNTRTRWLLDDPDPAIERSQEVADETVARMDDGEIDAAGGTGESDPVLAVRDALVTFDADVIVLFTHEGGERNWLEEGLVEEVRALADVPVEHVVVTGAD
jgi:hypothetical protein